MRMLTRCGSSSAEIRCLHRLKRLSPIAKRTELYYPMKSASRGRCLVLNFKDFTIDQPVRHGSEYDVNALEKTFKALGFEFEVKHNLTRKNTIDYLQNASTFDHEKYDCFVLCILSHGDNGIIYCNDGFIKIDEIVNLFTSNRCPTLTGKPKVFFIQACQAYFYLLYLSTYPGFFAWRNSFYGSWFVQDLCATLKEHAEEHDLVTMCTLTSQKIAFGRQSNVPNDKEKHMKKQMPYLVSTLTRLIRFNQSVKMDEPDADETVSRAMKLKS
ncbi:Caspase-7 [Tyrophagus putrescentiae]|nr:Caspase-7 [Tyrophagus putrescentiae]